MRMSFTKAYSSEPLFRELRHGLLVILFSVSAVGLYTLFSLTEKAPMTPFIFLGLLFILVSAHSIAAALVWPHRDRIGLQGRVLAILWFGLVLWYWFLSPLYYLLVINTNTLQLRWASFTFIWEVPLIGGVFVALALFRLQPILQFKKGKTFSISSQRLWQRVSSYPLEIAVLLFVFTLLGYSVGIWQNFYFAQQPVIEQVKVFMNGGVISFHLGVFYFLSLDLLLSPTLLEVRKKFHLPAQKGRSMGRRFFLVTLVTSLGSMALVSIFIVAMVQDILAQRVAREIQQVLRQDPEMLVEHRLINQWFPNERMIFSTVNLATDWCLCDIAPETQARIIQEPRGATRDIHGEYKIVGWETNLDTGEKRFIILYFDEKAIAFWSVTGFALLAVVFMVMINGALVLIYTMILSQPLQELVKALKRSEKDQVPLEVSVGADDELTLLSEALSHYVQTEQEEMAAKDAYISIMAHRLRTPLGNMRWRLESLLKKGEISSKEKQKEEMVGLYEKTLEMILIVNNLLQTIRIDQHRDFVQAEELKISDLIWQGIEEIVPISQKMELTVEFNPPANEPAQYFDRQQMRDVVVNLLINAAKYNRPHGEITIILQYRDSQIYLEITDTGVGIPWQDQKHIFDKFFRAKNAKHIETEGSGLGLYLVRSYVKEWGGSIEFTSRINVGTTFSLAIPQRTKEKK